MARALLVEIFGDAKQFAGELDKAAGKTRQFGKVAGVAGLALAGGLVYGMEKSVKAAMNQQAATANLEQTLKSTHQSVAAMTPILETAADSSRKLGFSDEDTSRALAKLEIATGNTKTAVKDLATVQDLARARSMDLSTASNAMAQAMTGSQRAAKQLGIIVVPVTDAVTKLKAGTEDLTTAQGIADLAQAKLQDKMATGQKVIEAVTAKVQGQASAYSDTAAGAMDKFRAQTEHLQVLLGTALLPAVTAVTTALASGAAFLADHTTVTKIAIGFLGVLATTLIAVSVATKIVAAAQAIMTAGQWALNVALDANPIGLIIIGLVALGAALVVAYRHSQTFRDIVSAAFTVVKDVVHALVVEYETLWSVAKTVFAFVEKIVVRVAGVVSGAVGGLIGDFKAVIGVLNDIIGVASAALGAIASVFTANNSTHTVGSTANPAATRARGGIPNVSGARAGGGPVSGGSAYLVGERGPELFVPGSSGVILPNRGGGGGVTLQVGPIYGAIDQPTARLWAATLKTELDRVIQYR